jgi:hypothetical protein
VAVTAEFQPLQNRIDARVSPLRKAVEVYGGNVQK